MKSKSKQSHSYKWQNLIKAGDTYTGYQKSLTKKSDHFFSEIEACVNSVDYKNGFLWGYIDKKIISISGKKECLKVYFEGEIIDGINHSFTSSLTANCEVLDTYFWNRFPSFKLITSLGNLKAHGQKFIYMRWQEKGTIK
jgi:hypothetical protein